MKNKSILLKLSNEEYEILKMIVKNSFSSSITSFIMGAIISHMIYLNIPDEYINVFKNSKRYNRYKH